MSTCIFCELYKSNKNIIYENNSLFVIIDAYPLTHGHILIIPKKHTTFFHKLSIEDLNEILPTIQKIVKKLNLKKYNLLQNNGHIQSVNHVHFHIIPYVDQNECLKISWDRCEIEKDYLNNTIDEFKKLLNEDKENI
ncbi:Adenosine 5'-monophosphoramidase [Gurleya vavrai]